MAKIKKKELKKRLEFEIADVNRGRVEWLHRFSRNPMMADSTFGTEESIQMAYLDGMIFAYEHLMHYYDLVEEQAE